MRIQAAACVDRRSRVVVPWEDWRTGGLYETWTIDRDMLGQGCRVAPRRVAPPYSQSLTINQIILHSGHPL